MEMIRRRSILVADDNHDLANSLSLLLTLVGYDVETVYNGHDAIRVAKSCTPDIVMLDIGLPGLNGFEVAEQLRSDERFKNILIIAASGYSPGMFRDRFEHAHFDHYFTKPVDLGTLLPIINNTARPWLAKASDDLPEAVEMWKEYFNRKDKRDY